MSEPIKVRKWVTWAPLASGRCTHGRAVVFNLMVNVIVHCDDDTDCDGDVEAS